MKKIIFILLLTLGLSSQGFAKIGIGIAEPKMLGIKNKKAEIGAFIRGLCEKTFHDDDRFEVRGGKEDIKDAIREWELAVSGLAGQKEFELNIPGVDYFVLPVLWVKRGGVRIVSLRVMDVHTGKLIGSETGSTSGDLGAEFRKTASRLRRTIHSAEVASTQNLKRLAVHDFGEGSAEGSLNDLAEALLAGQFCLDKRVETVERENLSYAIEERQLVAAGLAENRRSLEGEFTEVMRVNLAVQGAISKTSDTRGREFFTFFVKLLDIKTSTIKANSLWGMSKGKRFAPSGEPLG